MAYAIRNLIFIRTAYIFTLVFLLIFFNAKLTVFLIDSYLVMMLCLQNLPKWLWLPQIIRGSAFNMFMPSGLTFFNQIPTSQQNWDSIKYLYLFCYLLLEICQDVLRRYPKSVNNYSGLLIYLFACIEIWDKLKFSWYNLELS